MTASYARPTGAHRPLDDTDAATIGGMTLNLVDALLVVVVLLSAWAGVRRGFVLATFQLATLAASLVAAYVGYPFVAAWLGENLPQLGVWAPPAGFLGLFVLVHLVVGALAHRIALGFSPRLHANRANRTLGVIPGLGNGLINALLVSMIVGTAPLSEDLGAAARDSELAGRLSEPAGWVEAQLMPVFDPAIRRTLQSFTVPPESHRSVALHFPVKQAQPRPDLEARMLDLLNAERAKQHLPPLAADPEMAQVARAHSRDMFARGYFSHVMPEGKDLAARVKDAHLRYLVAGENLAYAHTLQTAHQGLMNSPGHRANILRPQFGRVGIGVLDGGMHGLMVTQNFRN